MRNGLTDVAGLTVGHAHDAQLMSGVTAILFDTPAAASVVVVGGAPGGRDLGCLEPDATVTAIDAIVLSGGSGFGLDAAGGVQAWLREHGRGLPVGPARVPIVPTAICFDLNNGGDKAWGRYPPYRELGYAAAASACNDDIALGTIGAGYGLSTVDLKGGLGTASARTSHGHTVAAIVAVNALGSALIGHGPHFWAAALERDGEFGGLGHPTTLPAANQLAPSWKGQTPAIQTTVPQTTATQTTSQTATETPPSTTIACIVTDATLSKAELKRTAMAASAGLARALRLSHAAMDGDTVFAASTCRRPRHDDPLRGMHELIEIGALAADCLTRAIARGVYAATIPQQSGQARWSGPPAWSVRFGRD